MKNILLFTFLLLTVGISAFAQPGGPGGVAPVITEIMYNPPEAGNDTLEFLEILNPSLTAPINMGGYYFSSGIQFTFPANFVLGAGEYVLLSGDSAIFEQWYGLEAFEWTGGTALSNDGEGLTLRTSAGAIADTVFFDDTNAWADADGTGYSLVLCDPSADNNLPASWTLSENATGLVVNSLPIFADPGAASTCTTTGIVDDNVITTIVYPNPTNGPFTLKFEDLSDNGSLTIHTSLGQMVHHQSLSIGTNSASVDVKLASGYYVITLDNGTTSEHHNLMVD